MRGHLFAIDFHVTFRVTVAELIDFPITMEKTVCCLRVTASTFKIHDFCQKAGEALKGFPSVLNFHTDCLRAFSINLENILILHQPLWKTVFANAGIRF
ncbi:hypothetical protein TSAR_000962 [Trichomalopsis sarcophagae]|uniref:Uncharacterized protein n=1 Tax=Trichomalopsis sarcophagae TaxID=543379 RepID=A0A232EZR2_9HYME|nr:hypothetical protein TSAR_000962 [Trichomalopsis sarcophagae]